MNNYAEMIQVAVAHHQSGRLAEAERIYRQVLAAEPTNADAWHLLGVMANQVEQHEVAIKCIGLALQLKPDFSVGWYNLGNALRDIGSSEEAIDAYEKAIALDSQHGGALTNLGNVLVTLGRLDEARACFDRAIAANPELAEAHNDRSFLFLQKGDFERGWQEQEWRWKTGRMTLKHLKQPRWEGEALSQKTVLLWAEQGFGDTLQFVRYAKVVKERIPEAQVVIECQPRLVPLLANTAGIDRLIPAGNQLPEFDMHCPLLSLPRVLRTTLETIPSQVPYIFAQPKLVEQWRERLIKGPGYRIGINWQGQLGKGEHLKRNIPLAHFLRLANVSGVQLVSLQYGEGRSELMASQAQAAAEGRPILDLGDDFDGVNGAFVDTAAVMMNLDLVITSDTAVAHLAGALGVPVWVALPFVSEWRWLLGTPDSPWYPTMRLFRQKRAGDWAGVFEEIKQALAESVG